jgi:hypothetical protein
MKTEDIFKGKPWSSLDEYFALVKKHHLSGHDLEEHLKRESKKKFIPYPNIYPPKPKPIT